MRAVLASILALGACVDDELDPPWRLDHERVIAVRVTPPHVQSGEVAQLDALVGHAGTPATIVQPIGATASPAPGDLFTVVHFNLDHWEIDGPDEARLDVAREELGLAAGEPVPLPISLVFPGPLYAKKIVMLGSTHANPTLPALAIDGAPPPANIEVATDRAVELSILATAEQTVRWLTSCGTLRAHDAPSTQLVVEAPCTGELVVVVRDSVGGVVWQTVPLTAR